MRETSGQFSATAKWLHWLVVFFMASLMMEAFGFAFTPPADRATAIPPHVSIGLIILGLTIARLAYRGVRPPPPLPPKTPGWMRRGAGIGHFLLYGIVLYMAVLGIWMAAISQVDIRFFSGWNLSELAPADPKLLAALRPWHFGGAVAFSIVLIGHICAALWHHVVLRDDVLTRMAPFSGYIRRTLVARNSLKAGH